MGRSDPYVLERIAAVIERHGLPVHLAGYPVDAVMAAMAHDKKRSAKTLRFVIPQAIGDVSVVDDPGDGSVRQAVRFILDE